MMTAESRHPSPHTRRGFTILEVLIAVMVLLVLCTLATQMATGMMGTVSQASGRVTASQKLERLRRMLSEDLSRLPRLTEQTMLLKAAGDESMWRAEMTLPVRSNAQRLAVNPWEQITYRWDQKSASLWREVQDGVTAGQAAEPVLTGLVDLRAEWLAVSPVQAQGVRVWEGFGTMPLALRIRAKFTDMWEEGETAELDGRAGRLREFTLLVPVGA